MKRLQLPKNKLARLAINIGFIVFWFFFSRNVISQYILAPIISHFDPSAIEGRSELIWLYLSIFKAIRSLPILLVTYFIFLRKLEPRYLLLPFCWIVGYSILHEVFKEVLPYSVKIGDTGLLIGPLSLPLFFYYLPVCLGCCFFISAKYRELLKTSAKLWEQLKPRPRITRSKDDAE